MATKRYPTRNKMIKALVSNAKDNIKKRDGYRCQHCKKKVEGRSCQGSHVIPMSAIGQTSLAFDELNIKTLCAYCHKYWWHSNPIESGAWFKKKYPKRYAYLKRKLSDRDSIRLTAKQLQDLYDKLKEKPPSK